ncbi:YciI family protein [Ferruginibacter sp. HRS2-29]|uniref:YciI family protein n=1 Tax=Ferruginibacter sp. HRS2-29 TaxID=2487334 RepID=UPI0020CD1335|nr:YciI family protein [Ferruginibacter sp. HRS2-29]MCP9749862.1 hypothetical protein [Ferruginibacter sp. HRS2-29]
MKKILFFTLLLLSVRASAQENAYDSILAKKLNADERGMKMYVLVILKTGPVKDLPKADRDSLFKGHINNIIRLADEGKLSLAGPFEKNELNYRGLFIFNVSTVEEAKSLVATDPAVKAGLFDAEYIQWYASAAVQEINGIHKKIQRKKIF